MEPRPVISFIRKKYLIQERDMQQDPFTTSVDQYFKRTQKRIYGLILTSLFFLILLIPSIILQQEFQEVVVFPLKGGYFTVKDKLDPPITLEIISSESYFLTDVQLYLDGHSIEQFTISKEMKINSTHKITSNKSFQIIRLISQFSYVPRSYLIILIIMLILSLFYLIQEILRKPKI